MDSSQFLRLMRNEEEGGEGHGEEGEIDEDKLRTIGILVGFLLPGSMLFIMVLLCILQCTLGDNDRYGKKRYANLVKDQAQQAEGENNNPRNLPEPRPKTLYTLVNDERQTSGPSSSPVGNLERTNTIPVTFYCPV